MTTRKDLPRIAIRVGVFAFLFFAIGFIFDPLLRWFLQDLAGPTLAVLFSSLFATWLAMRIFEARPIFDVGLWWGRLSADNLAVGVIAGAASALLVTTLPLAVGAASIVRHAPADRGGLLVALGSIAAGSAGEEIFFRGYGFQLLVAGIGGWGAILPIGALFGLMHAANPDASVLGTINTAGFGILFGYAYLRSRDLWLPIGLHFGWNFTLPLFGANLSGIKIFKEITGHEMAWRAGRLWSGGEYGPEASLLTSLVFIPLCLFLWKGPIRRQPSPLTDPPAEGVRCESSPSLPS